MEPLKRPVEESVEIRTILAAVSGGAASSGVVDLACRLALRFDSHVEALHVQPDPREMVVAAADGFAMPLSGEIMERARQDAADTAAAARRIFDAAMAQHALPLREAPPPPGTDPALLRQASACWCEATGYGPVAVAGRARLFDLLILGQSGRVVDQPYSDAIEESLLASGRPVLIAPAEPPKVLGEIIALAWNDSPQSARALASALPFLRAARAVHILSIGETGAGDLARQLGWYGVRATTNAIDRVDHVGPGEWLLAAARDRGADLLVMGGYGRAPWRELLFGGATRQALARGLLPLLLSH
jgi:nucleotide-binding universal stress UspA family protein